MAERSYERPTMVDLGSFAQQTRRWKRSWGWDHNWNNDWRRRRRWWW